MNEIEVGDLVLVPGYPVQGFPDEGDQTGLVTEVEKHKDLLTKTKVLVYRVMLNDNIWAYQSYDIELVSKGNQAKQ